MVPILITKNWICNSNYSIFVFISYSSWKISVENQVWKIKPLKTYYGLHKTETSTYHNLFPQKMESRQSRSRPFDQAEIVQLSSLVFYKEKKVLLMFNLKPRKRAFRVEQNSSWKLIWCAKIFPSF